MTEDEYDSRVPKEEKTDWRKDVQRALVAPSFAVNQEDFMKRVCSAIDVVACEYPGWNAYKEINNKVNLLTIEYKDKFKKWKEINEPVKWYQRFHTEKRYQVELHQKIWTFLKNYCARHGMLVEGPRDSRATLYDEENL